MLATTVTKKRGGRKKAKRTPRQNSVTLLRGVLSASRPRPDEKSSSSERTKYAVRFADAMAKRLAKGLNPFFPGIKASPTRSAASVAGAKQLDINYSTLEAGLGLGISLKSVHLRDAASNRYTHNMKRNEEELRVEASGYHKRQPYAVMVGILFLPFDSCDDASKQSSSFGSWVRHLRPYTGRTSAHDDFDRFERLFIGLYEMRNCELRFFDVATAPPKRGRPVEEDLLTYEAFIEAIRFEFRKRNRNDFVWADGESEPVDPS